ncbi:MAG: TldD/PmbA family protein [Oscillospiraceae bacterium]|jgi:TldD protein|nr:TldD/PmbA family protein [Oscillospiraceae bacterium]
MKAPFSPYLDALAPGMKALADILGRSFDYVSILSTDSVGFTVSISQRSKRVTGTNMTTERGNVVRVWRNGQYSEYAFNEVSGSIEELAETIRKELDRQFAVLALTGTKAFDTPILADEPLELFVEKETERLPEQEDMAALVERFTGLSARGMETIPRALDCLLNASSTHICKMFLTKNRFLRQSYVYTEGSCAAYAPNDAGEIKFAYNGVSGCCGPEVLEGLKKVVEELPKTMEEMLASEKIVPGEYEIITDPGISGLIAHEAFGHGVEMDMFVKKRALGAEYIGKRVGSDLCTMHEGALCEESVTAYAFDDEGTLAGDVTEIDHGILKTGICDALAALRLGTVPTGNGKRENFAHKAYTRMTNTIFDSGDSTFEEMVASVKHGYLLRGTESGMEDPKHWGIQCIIARGYEIKDGAFTGKVVSPVVMTGYVPDLLGGICMASRDRKVDGNGGCGKGHKEWVKVADGGPYLKTKARLG